MSRSHIITIAVVALIVVAGCSTSPNPSSDPTSETTELPATQTMVASEPAEGTLEVHFINVGQSVSTLIIGPTGETMLIDSGHFRDDGEYVLQYLQAHDISRIDYLVTSHNDADHIGGNAAVIEYFETEGDGIGAIYDPGIAASTQTYAEYLDAVEEYDVTLYETREGDTIPFEGVEVSVLGPPEPYLESEARNENSIVLKFVHGESSFLFTGDAEDDQEEYLVENYGQQLQSTVMKAGHHGSSSSSSGPILDAANPEAVIISSPYDSQYGHPTEDVLQRLADRSIPTYWTATHGNIVLVSDGSGISVRTQQRAPTNPLDLRDGSPIEPGTGGGVVERMQLGDGPSPSEQVTTAQSTTVVTDGGTSTGTLAVTEINADAEGDDRENLNDEYVVLKNTGDTAIDLTGWTVTDEAGQEYTFPDGYTLVAGSTVTLRTGSGDDTDSELYWGSGSPIWNNGGDTVIITNSDGETVLMEEY